MPGPATTSLADQVARVGTVNEDLLERVRHEVLTVATGWQKEYGQYQSGGWGTVSLMNASGDPADVQIADCTPVETSLLTAMPQTRAFLRGLGLDYMWVRLAKLGTNSYLWEHRDYTELDQVERYRLHVPVLTNSSAMLVTGGSSVLLTAGGIWRLTPTYAHGVCNLLGPERIHLIADCYPSARLSQLTARAELPQVGVRQLPSLDDSDVDRHSNTAFNLASLGYVSTAEQYLLRLFYAHALPEGRLYDLIIALHRCRADHDAVEAWQNRKALMLGHPLNGTPKGDSP